MNIDHSTLEEPRKSRFENFAAILGRLFGSVRNLIDDIKMNHTSSKLQTITRINETLFETTESSNCINTTKVNIKIPYKDIFSI